MENTNEIRIGILTWFDPTNCGSALQAYALHRYLRQIGFNAHIINYVPQWCRGDYMLMPLKTLSFKRKIKRAIKSIFLPYSSHLPMQFRKRISPFYSFYNKYCQMTSACTEESIAECCKHFSTIITGSDQVWNPNFIDPIFLQCFVSGDINQISYATSFGGTILPEEKQIMYKKYLSSFSAISIREKEGKDILKTIGIESEVLIDPTLLLDSAHYRSMANKVAHIKKPFAFCYFLKTDREYKLQIQDYIRHHHLEAVGFSFDEKDYTWMRQVDIMGPSEWLWLIDNADIVFTNSYHATIFSLILHTPFYTFVRFAHNEPIEQNSRLEQLDQYFELSEYFITKEIPKIQPYSFIKFEERLPELKHQAITYLLKNIK